MSKLWICGQLIGEWSELGNVWAFQGVFSDEATATRACMDETYFIFPADLDAFLSKEMVVPKDVIYPRIEQEM
jgi:hypothetical protein